MSEEKKAGHTPGPWAWDESDDSLSGFGDTPMVIETAGYEGSWMSRTKHREANMRLIAAAPDLLAALKQLRSHCEAQGWLLKSHAVAAMDAARDAIAKAEDQS